MADPCEKLVRSLYAWEVEEFRPVFGSSLKYERVRVHECTNIADAIDQLGRRLKGMPPSSEGSHNAITLGNHCIFPVTMPKLKPEPGNPEVYKLDWLVHELTHAWQYQKIGWRYIFKALNAQFKEKEKAYDFGGEDGLRKSMQKNMSFKKFNPEQQGNICQAYYLRLKAGQDCSAWQPFIDEIHNWA
jgi:hypothetical protein